MKDYLVGFSIAVIAAIILFFFYIVPQQKLVEQKIDDSYNAGYAACFEDIDTVFIPGEPVIIEREIEVFIEKPAEVTEENDSILHIAASIDTAIYSREDSIGIQATIELEINKNEIISDPLIEWFLNIKHKHLEQQPDTIKIKVPKLVTKIEKETNLLYILLSFLIGMALPFII